MASIKIVLRTNKLKKDGTCPLALRIIKDRKTRYIFSGYYIKEKEWNSEESKVRKSHRNSARLNNLLLKKIGEAEEILLETDSSGVEISANSLKKKIKRENENISFFELAEKRINEYKTKGTFSVANAEQSILNNIEQFVGNKELAFEEINQSFISNLKLFCSTTLGQKSSRTIANQLIFIRTVFNIAIKEGIVKEKHYPFAAENEKIKITSGHKIGLTRKEVSKIESLDLEPNSQIWHTKNVWLFAFYFAGIRVSDVLSLKWSDLKDNRLYYIMNKNDKTISLKIPEKAVDILTNYIDRKTGSLTFVFPYLDNAKTADKKDVFTKTRTATKLLNNYLKKISTLAGIDKNLSNHIARHTFGNIAGDKIHPLMLQKLYRHSDLKTTINYQSNFIHKEADDALDAVIGED